MTSSTTRHDLPRMDDSDALADVAQAIRDLADAVDAALPQAGTGIVSLVAASQAFVTVTFPHAFAAAPVVTANVDGNASYYADVSNVTTTQARIYAIHRDGTNATVSVNVTWTAVKETT